jgi:hypothetical protein
MASCRRRAVSPSGLPDAVAALWSGPEPEEKKKKMLIRFQLVEDEAVQSRRNNNLSVGTKRIGTRTSTKSGTAKARY